MVKYSNVQIFKCSNAKYQMSNGNKVKLMSAHTSGVPSIIFIHIQRWKIVMQITHLLCYLFGLKFASVLIFTLFTSLYKYYAYFTLIF